MLLQEKRKTKSYNYLKYYLNCFLNLLFYNFIYITEILHIYMKYHSISTDLLNLRVLKRYINSSTYILQQ